MSYRQVYNARTDSSIGLIEGAKKVLGSVYSYRWLIWRGIKRDFKAPYRQSVFSTFWAVFMPMLPVSVYVILVKFKVLTVSSEIPYPLYVGIGFTLWMLLMGGITCAINRPLADRQLLTKTKYPLIVSILSGYGILLFETFVRLVLVVGLMLWYGFLPGWGFFLISILIFPMLIFSISVGVILSLLNIVSRDVKNIVEVVSRYGIFLSSVIFPLPDGGFLGFVKDVNILSHFIDRLREWMLFGGMQNYPDYIVQLVVSLILLIVSFRLLVATEKRVIEYL